MFGSNQIMKKILILFITAGFLFLGSVNATPKAKSYGPVKSGQTLWSIAYKTRPKGVSRLKMMNALHKFNPSAFDKGNINRLKKGAMLNLPVSKEQVASILAGDIVEVAQSGDDSSKDIDTLRDELSSVKEALARSKEALKGLNEQSNELKKVQGEIALLTKENEALKSSNGNALEEAKQELVAVREQFEKAQNQIKTLEDEKLALQEATKNATSESDVEEGNKALAVVTAELVKTKELVKTLAEKNKELQSNNLDPKLLDKAKEELATSHEALEALKVQNQLLRDQAANADISQEERRENNKKFSETIAALNADIGVLRSRIKELEELEKMKDNHISELQKSLDHATAVIKEQADVNKKMYARLNELERKDEEEEQQAAAAVADNSNPSNPTPPAEQSATNATGDGSSANKPNIVNFSGTSEINGSILGVKNTLKDISPKFWLMLTLAGLLFVVALLWRVISGKDDLETAM